MDNSLIHLKGGEMEGKRKGEEEAREERARQTQEEKRREEWTYKKSMC